MMSLLTVVLGLLQIALLSWNTSARTLKEKCQPREELPPPSKPIHVYTYTREINVTVYHCLMKVEPMYNDSSDFCLKCIEKIPSYWVGESTYQYSDVTQNCIYAFYTNIFVDKYGRRHINSTAVPLECDCGNNNIFYLTTTAILTKYEARADIINNRITLRSGEECRYTPGYCNVHRDDIEVTWEVEGDDLFCDSFRELDVSNSYYLYLNHEKHVIMQSPKGYSAIEIGRKQKMCDVYVWQTKREDLVISESAVVGTTKSSLEALDELDVSFRDNKIMYDFLVESCEVPSSSRIRYNTLLRKFKAKDTEKYTENSGVISDEQDVKHQRPLSDIDEDEEKRGATGIDWMLYTSYILIGAIVCYVAYLAAILLVFMKRLVQKCLGKRDRKRKATTDSSAIYESITDL